VGQKFPGGKPVWHSDLSDRKLSDLFGFVEALVLSPQACPDMLLEGTSRGFTKAGRAGTPGIWLPTSESAGHRR
jgi:hypothetical protein